MSPFNPTLPYNDLPPLPPPYEIDSKAILNKCISANRELAGLREAARRIPNQNVLINTIPLREANDSSAIENVVTTNDKLFRFANVDPEAADPATRETLRYRTALLHGFNNIKTRPLTTQTAVTVCRIIKGIDLDIRSLPGTSVANKTTGEIVYTPPEGANVIRGKLSNWEAFLHEATQFDALIRMAVGHYQFEAIHPFPDGNGRTGRALNILFLIDQQLLDLPILYLSRYINTHRSDYYELLGRVTTSAAWEPWIYFMLNAVEETSRWTIDKIAAIERLLSETVAYVRAALPKIYSRELVEIFFMQPYCRTGDLLGHKLAGHRNTASKYLKDLTSAGVLEYRKEGREALYLNKRLLELLTRDKNTYAAFPDVRQPVAA
jgi:cell filamentation protein, protein adenylyltransferase